MTKKFLFLFVLGSLLCFAGCNLEKLPLSTGTASPAQNPSVAIDLPPVNVSAISLPVVQETEKASDGTEIFVSTYQNVELVLPDAEMADKVTLDLLNRMDTSLDAQDILTQAKADYTPSGAWQSYICRNIYSPTRLDNGVLSLFGELTTYSGSAHAEGVYRSVSYDLATGDVLELHNVLLPHFDMNVLTGAIKAALNEQEAENYLYSYYTQVVDDRFAEDVLDDENWYFSQTGLCFYFPPYEIAPFSSGVIVAEVPYGKLAGILENAYFPEEIPATEGAMVKEAFDPEAYESFWEITLENGSAKILLHPSTNLYNIRLEWGSNGEEFTPEYTLFAAGALSPTDAIVITYANESTLSDLRISYTSGEKTVCQSILKNLEGKK